MQLLRWTFACWFVLSLVFGALAHANDPMAKPKDAAAKEHLSQGNKLYRLREFEKAIEEYKAGALAEDAPVFLYNLGQCYRQLGKYEDAIWHYERFLSRGQPSGDLKTTVEDFVKQMKAELEKKAMSQPPTEPAPDATQPAGTEPQHEVVSPVPEVPDPDVDPWYADGLGWGLAGSGVVAVAAGGYLLLNAADLDEQANVEDRQEVRTQLRDKASTRRLAGTIVGIGGLGLLATGIAKLVIHPNPRETTSTAWSIGIMSNGVQVFGTF